MCWIWDRMLRRKERTSSRSANKAKERLQFILLHDRMNLPPGQLQAMKEEVLTVISKYLAVTGSESDIEIAFRQRDRDSSMLVAEIPLPKGLQLSSDKPDVAADEDE